MNNQISEKETLEKNIRMTKIGMWAAPALPLVGLLFTQNMIVILCLVFGAVVSVLSSMVNLKKMQKQLDTMKDMTPQQQQKSYAKFQKKRMVVLAILLVVAVFCFMAGNGAFDSILKSNSKSDAEKCKICKQEKDLVAGFGMCGDCYHDFDEWNKNSQKDK